jgi:hypothetical protein
MSMYGNHEQRSWTRLAILMCAILIIGCQPDPAHREPYAPLAGVTISASEAQADKLIETLRSFAKSEHLQLEDGSFPKLGRPVVNMELRINEETYFHIENFFDPSVFHLNAYSHQRREIWEPTWDRLIEKLRDALGQEAVKPMSFESPSAPSSSR